MNELLASLDETTRRQKKASAPSHSAWVSANAGSGKTHVLTQRVIRLMLAGTRPSAILCLTYTKAAASEMSNRVFERLSRWTSMDDATLAAEIEKMEDSPPDAAKLAEARKLFARALESPGGLKIQTIHAFCEALLHQFPLEANVAGHFSVLDDKASASLIAEARRALLSATQAETDRQLAKAFHDILGIVDETGLEQMLKEIIGKRTALGHFFAVARERGGVEQLLAETLALDPGDDLAAIAASVWPLPGLEGGHLTRYIELANSLGKNKVQQTAARLAQAVGENDVLSRFEILRKTFISSNDEPYADGQFFTKAMLNHDPDLCGRMPEAAQHVFAVWDLYKTRQIYEMTLNALVLAERLLENYEALKKERGYLDFEDFINRAEALLKKSEIGPWVHYKLDQGIDHILIDEAQDTSPTQWEIIRALTEEFFAGESSRNINRTIFAVGDEKQSIYSFQGARPERFAIERRTLERRAKASERGFEPVSLHMSFRSVADVLTAVDQVFSLPDNARGLSFEHQEIIHQSSRITHTGQVDIWDTIAEETGDDGDADWLAPFDRPSEQSSAVKLARRMAAAIEDMVGKATIHTRDGVRFVTPGDIMVLVRKRDAFAAALTRELKRGNKVPVAGADRLVLSSHIAIQDLLSLGRFLLLSEDDLSLAELVKSPLFDLDEERLFELCGNREEGESVWAKLQRLAETDPVWEGVHGALLSWRELACRLRVHDFYAHLLAADGGRARFLARFGSEVGDVLDEFLSFALQHEQAGLPGLAAFIAVMERDAPEIKREQEKGRDEVRVMTVHASKGLEAPVVFLVDSSSPAFDAQKAPKVRLIRHPDAHLELEVPVWYPRTEFNNQVIAADNERLKGADEEEHRRLLYVGMTRASDRLIVCSYRKKRDVTGTWAKMVGEALTLDDKGRCTPTTFHASGVEDWQGWTWRSSQQADTGAVQTAVQAEEKPPRSIPPQLFEPLPDTGQLPRPLVPSGAHAMIDEEAGDDIVPSAIFREKLEVGGGRTRGKVLHALLQNLPAFEPAERRAAAMRYLSRSLPHWSEERQAELADRVLAILEDPRLARLHGPESRAEVSIMGTIRLDGTERAVSGRVDRMGIADGRVFVLDYKTTMVPPESEEEIPFLHRAQLAIYREVLKPLFPDKEIECLLLYTEGPHLYSIPGGELEKALLAISDQSSTH